MESLLLLDADIIIHLLENNYWIAVISKYKVYVASTVLREVEYYNDKNSKKVFVDLLKYVKDGEIIEVEASPAEQKALLLELRKDGLDGLDPGELECIAILFINKIDGIKFCVKDRLAIKALVALELREEIVSLEEVLRSSGVIRSKEKVDYEFSKKKFKDLVTQEELNSL